MRITTVSLVGFLLSALGSLAQDVSIVSPTKGSNITAGQKLQIVLNLQGTTSSVTHIVFSNGFKTTKYHDPTSLGRPYAGSVSFTSNFTSNSTHLGLDPSKGTYTYEITVPSAKKFLDGFSTPYELTISHLYLLGATFTPILKLTSVQVNVQEYNSTGGQLDPNPKGANNPNIGHVPWDPIQGGKDPKAGGSPSYPKDGKDSKTGGNSWESKGGKAPAEL